MAHVLLVGYGAMGSALKKSWQNHHKVAVIDPQTQDAYANVEELPRGYRPDVILFAVKPQVIPAVLPLYQRFTGKGLLFITIAAGIALDTYYQALGKGENIVRTMPNLPVTVGQGMTALVTRSVLNKQHHQLVENLFTTAGKAIWLEDESLIDSVTAISGSGPAYFFRFVECLAEAGQAMGLPVGIAATLAKQTAVGAGTMLANLPESPSQLREKVTSPGGTTAAALDVFNTQGSLSTLVTKATQAALRRAIELKEQR